MAVGYWEEGEGGVQQVVGGEKRESLKDVEAGRTWVAGEQTGVSEEGIQEHGHQGIVEDRGGSELILEMNRSLC